MLDRIAPEPRSVGTIYRLRDQLPWPTDRGFRILSIDGGGIRGLLPVSILAELEARYLGGQSAGRCFDMIAGTSVGGIIALGLSIGMSATEIREFLVMRGPEIFPYRTRISRAAIRAYRGLLYAYSRGPLESALREILGERQLGASVTRLCIPAFEGRYGEPYIFKTAHHPDFKGDWKEPMVKVALSTAAAPTYFGPLRSDDGYIFVDGGVWANNPVMIAVVDALSCYQLPRRNVRVLSLGCGEHTYAVGWRQKIGGLLGWHDIMLAAIRLQSKNVVGQAGLLVGRDQLARLDAPDGFPLMALDDFDGAYELLPPLARELVDREGQRIAQMFLGSHVSALEPCYR